MEPNQIPVTPTTVVTPVIVPPKPTKTSYGALAGIVVILLAVTCGAYYLLNLRLDEMVLMQEQQAAVYALDTQSDSTEPEAIESDLNAESPDEFDAELDKAFAEMDASFVAE